MIWYDSDMIWCDIISILCVCVCCACTSVPKILDASAPRLLLTHHSRSIQLTPITIFLLSRNNWVCNCGLDPDQNIANETKPLCPIMFVRHFIRQSWVGIVLKKIGIIQKYGIIILLKKIWSSSPRRLTYNRTWKMLPLGKNTRNIPNSNHQLLDSSR